MKNSKYLPHRRQNSKYDERLDVFKNTKNPQDTNLSGQNSEQNNEGLANDLLAPLAQNEASRDALDAYMEQLDKTFDISDIDTVQPFLPLSSDESLQDIGMKFVSLSPEDVQSILNEGYQVISVEGMDVSNPEQLHAFLEEILLQMGDQNGHNPEDLQAFAQAIEQMRLAPGESVAIQTEISDIQDNQIRIDRSDIVQRVLKARSKDTSVTVVPGPKTAQ